MWCLCVLFMHADNFRVYIYAEIGIQVLLTRTGSMFTASACVHARTHAHTHTRTHTHTLKSSALCYGYDVHMSIALCRTKLRHMLTRDWLGFFERFGKEWLFPSLRDAVNHAEMGVRLVVGELSKGK